MNNLELSTLRHRVETLDAELDALRLLVLSLLGRMAIDDAKTVQAVAAMVEEARNSLRAAKQPTVRHQTIAREIDTVSKLMRQVIHASQKH